MANKTDGKAKTAKRDDSRVIIHFDYDCFYASVFEAENPALKALPLAVQQKQIVVTCNYEARRRGLRKLQPLREARMTCPDVVIVLGEDLTKFRDASKALYTFLRSYTWSGRIEKLGFDEVFLDVTDIVQYNVGLLNHNDLSNSFFHLDRGDPTVGFAYDASKFSGEGFPPSHVPANVSGYDTLHARLLVGSHLAEHLRHQLEEQKGYTSTAGISSSKLLSKLAGNVHKPKNHTTLLPPYDVDGNGQSNVLQFLDTHEIGRIPGVGFKLAHKIRNHVLGSQAEFDAGLVYGDPSERVTVKDVRLFPGMGPELLEQVLGGLGSPRGIGGTIWKLISGIDDTEVGIARNVPRQISIEDSYRRLDTFEEVRKELLMLARSLIRRMHVDLMEDEEDDITSEVDADGGRKPVSIHKRWLAHPRTLRLSTRPRPPLNPDGSRSRALNRVSRSGPMPNFIFSFTDSVDAVANRLVGETLIGMFRKLHPEKSRWNLSLVNLAATNMAEAAADTKNSSGRDISRMFRMQERVLKDWKVEDRDVAPSDNGGESPDPTPGPEMDNAATPANESGEIIEGEDLASRSSHEEGEWDREGEEDEMLVICPICGTKMPQFAASAHDTFHTMED